MHNEKIIYCLEDNNITFIMDFRYSPVPYIQKPSQPDASDSCLGEQHERISSSFKIQSTWHSEEHDCMDTKSTRRLSLSNV